MKFTMICRDPSYFRPLWGRVNVLPFKGFGTRTCLLAGFSWHMPDQLELTIEHDPEGFKGDKYLAQSFHMLDSAEQKKPGRPKGT
jgi:hypothetical protein